MKGTRQSPTLIQCPLPNYPQPDVLDVEVSTNGKDFSNNGIQFGFYDPFVLRVTPNLISKTGSTRIEIRGFGFVDSSKVGGLKVLYDNDIDNYYCTSDNNKCVVDADYIDKNTISAPTFPLNIFSLPDGERIRDFEAINVEVAVFDDKFTQNHIKVHYYEDPKFESLSQNSASADSYSPIMIKTDFHFDINNKEVLLENAEFKCRWSSMDRRHLLYTDGQAITYPFKAGADPTHIRCSTPTWPLHRRNSEIVKLDVTSNGFDYFGNFDFMFKDKYDSSKTYSGKGPNEGGTDVKLVGGGFKAQQDVMTKWGVINIEATNKDNVYDHSGTTYINKRKEANSIESHLHNHQSRQETFDTLNKNSASLSNWREPHGGPIYLGVESHEDTNLEIPSELEKYLYTTSFIEHYYYKQPVVKNIHPHGGPIEGGTEIVVEGANFDFMPEYGVIPHCQIGDKIVEGKFESTVRIICPSPPGDKLNTKYPVKVSLNGEDFVETGNTFHYYKNSKISKIHPTSGPIAGGTTVYLQGEEFSDMSTQNEFQCKFQPLNKDIPPKYTPARYFNKTTVMCASPSGFGNVDVVDVDVTFNGVDYTNSKNQFTYYNIITAHPISGPADGAGQNIHIRGQGFKDDGNIKCKLDTSEYTPNHISWGDISCPVLSAKQGKEFFGNVPFGVTVNGEDWHQFPGGYHYYEQPTVKDIYPKYGPDQGHGKIHFYGSKFRSDFPNAQPFCKIGDHYAKATIIDAGNAECEISELPLSGSETSFPAQLSLNNATWTETNKNTFYTPYGIHHLSPNSGPVSGGTEIIVTGSGFMNSGSPRCSFGAGEHSATTNGKVLSHDKMTCQSPADYEVPKQLSLPFTVPFSVAFNKDEYEPWTKSAHVFRFYKQPHVSGCSPSESEIGKVQEVFVYASKGSEFISPTPIQGSEYSDYGIYCQFGKYGKTPGIWVNETLIRCVTPALQERPESLDHDTVVLSVAQNGQNFNENESN